MERNYQRKTKRGEYGLETLGIALTKVRSGEISKRKAEQIYKVLSKTLTRHVKGLVASTGQLGHKENAVQRRNM